jgi:signal peptidase II
LPQNCIQRKDYLFFPNAAQTIFMKNHFTKYIFIIVLIIGNIGCDQATKQMAIDNLKNEPQVSYCENTFILTYAENPGAFYGNGANLKEPVKSLILIVLPVVALGFLLVYSFKTGWSEAIAFSFVLGGGISNIFDRIAYGKVVDFMNMGIGDFRTGIFNVADMAIMFGMGLLIFLFLKKK